MIKLLHSGFINYPLKKVKYNNLPYSYKLYDVYWIRTVWFENKIKQVRLNHVKVNKEFNEHSLNQFNKNSNCPPMERQYKPFDDVLIEFLIGKLLGDGFARKGTSKIKENATGTIFTFAQSSKQLEYIENMYSFLLEYNLCGDRIPHLERTNLKETNSDNITYKYTLYTKSNIYFDNIYDAFYRYDPITKHYVKGLYNKEFIYNYFTPFSLAIWIMDDGTNQNGHIKLCTDSFTKKDIEWLQDLLLNKLNIKSNLHEAKNKIYKPDQFRIYIVAKSMPRLRNIVTPYFIPSMLYKLFDNKSKTPKDNRPKRIQVTDTVTNITTVYSSLRQLNNNSSLSRSGIATHLRKKETKLYKSKYIIIEL